MAQASGASAWSRRLTRRLSTRTVGDRGSEIQYERPPELVKTLVPARAPTNGAGLCVPQRPREYTRRLLSLISLDPGKLSTDDRCAGLFLLLVGHPVCRNSSILNPAWPPGTGTSIELLGAPAGVRDASAGSGAA